MCVCVCWPLARTHIVRRPPHLAGWLGRLACFESILSGWPDRRTASANVGLGERGRLPALERVARMAVRCSEVIIIIAVITFAADT